MQAEQCKVEEFQIFHTKNPNFHLHYIHNVYSANLCFCIKVKNCDDLRKMFGYENLLDIPDDTFLKS